MAKYHFDETSVYKLIYDLFNDNSSNGKVKYAIGSYYPMEDNQVGFTKKFTQSNDRFDIVTKMSDDTLEVTKQSYVPIGITSLNAGYFAHDTIREVTYQPTLELLVYAEKEGVYNALYAILQEIRNKLIQYETTVDLTYLNLDDKDSVKITETCKAIVMSSEINLGDLVRVSGNAYLSMSMELTIEVTNYGEYANQEHSYLSVSSVESGTEYEIFPTKWGWGTGIDTEGSQLLNDVDITYDKHSDQVLHIPKSTTHAKSFGLQINFANPILYKIFKDSRLPAKATSQEIWNYRSTVSKYNSVSGNFEIDTNLTVDDEFLMTTKAIEEVSQGEKYFILVTLTPAYNKG